MHIGRIPGATRVLGKSQGYTELPVRDAIVLGGKGTRWPVMVTAWLPDVEDLIKLNRGAPLLVTLMGEDHPPMTMTVGEVPDRYPARLSTESDLMRCGLSADEAKLMAAKLSAHGLRVVPLAA